MCTPIKDKHADPVYACKSVILKAGELLEEIIRTEERAG
jgi:hypothetical protein